MSMSVEHEQGPVEILCKEIGFRFDKRLETFDVFVSFVSTLVAVVGDMRSLDQLTSPATGRAPSDASGEVLGRVIGMLIAPTRAGMIRDAASVHCFIHEVHPEETYPADHLIDMLSGCVSAIRFGLEAPCQSRHAAEAANHIWGQRYGVRLFDRFTSGWQHEWTREQLQRAITGLIPG